jgi:hypothetical protein
MAALAVSVATAATASQTLVGTTSSPTGINGLAVDGTTYNVTFSTTILNSFVEGSSVSIDANQALAAALNSLSVTGLGNSSAQSAYVIDIDNSLSSFYALRIIAPSRIQTERMAVRRIAHWTERKSTLRFS